MSRRVVPAVVLMALLTLTSAVGSRGQDQSLVSADLQQGALQRGTVRVLIHIGTPYVAEAHLPTPAHVVAQRQDIAATQRLVRGGLRGVSHRVIRDFRGTVPMMALEVGPDGLRMLESLRGVVTAVVEDRPRHPSLVESVPRIQADRAVAFGYDGSGAVIAILDTGVDKAHPFLRSAAGASRVVHEACFSSTTAGATTLCPNGLEQDLGPGAGVACSPSVDGCDHGTLVAGIAAGRGASFNGVAPGADIVSIQVFSRINDTAFCGGPAFTPCVGSFPSDQLEAGVYVRDTLLAAPLSMKVASINLSLGSGSFTVPCDASFPGETTLFTDLRARGVATVVASGNGGFGSSVAAPSCIGAAVSVGATTDPPGEAIASFSNRAPGMSLLAPGVSITTSAPGGVFVSVSGTSMAAPHVAGVFAIFKEAVPTATVSQVLSALQATGQSIGGFKRVRVFDALATFANVVPRIQFSSPTYSTPEGDATHTATITVTRTGPAAALAGGTSTVLISTSGGTATAGTSGAADYVAITNQLVTFGPGETAKDVLITIRGDFTTEPNETVGLTLSSPTGAVLGTSTAVLTIVNDDDPGTVSFDQSLYTVTEGSGPATITLRRTGGLAADTVAFVSTTDGTAKAGSDYTALTNRAVTFTAGAATATFTVTIADDSLVEPNETVNLRIASVSPGATIGSPRTAVLGIVNDDLSGTVQFSQADYAVTEGTATAVITLERTGTSAGASVQYRVAPGNPGTATGGLDYTLATGTVTFGAGQTTRTFTVAIVDDALVEPDETVRLELFNPDGGLGLGPRSTATLTIHDNDAPTFRFGAAAYTVAEGATARVTVLRANGVGSVVTVGYQVQAAGTATGGGQDYTLPSGTLTFAIGVTSQTITIPTTQDTLFEGSETIVLKLVNPSPGAVIAPDTTTVTITDNDTPGTIQFSTTAYSVVESAGPALVRVTRAGSNLASGVTVQFTTTNGTATAGADYTNASQVLTFGAGEAFKDVAVTILDDNLPEANETINLALSNPSTGALLGTRTTAVLTILDDEQSLQFNPATYTVTEASTPVTVTVTRTGPPLGTVTVDYASAGGGATPGADYTSVAGTLTYPPGVTSRTFTVPILSDTLSEATETILLQLSNPTGSASLGAPSTATLSIVDNDPAGMIRFSAATYTVSEKTAAATVTVQRIQGTASEVTVDYATVGGGTATAGVDYTATTGTLTFGVNQTSKTFTIPILNDRLYEVAKTVNLALSNLIGGATLGTPGTAVLTITDDDTPGTIQFSTTAYSVSESAGPALVRLTRTGSNLAGGVTVQFTTTNGTATAGADYTNATQVVTFAAGETVKDIPITILDDGLAEGNETVALTLSNASAGATLGTRTTAVLTILDDEQALQFSAPAYVVTEASTPVTITVTRSGPPLGTLTVDYATVAGSATPGLDYVDVSGTLTFPPGATSRTFTVRILSDTVFEPTESISLLLSHPTGGALLGAQSTATVAILDNDTAGAIRFSAATYTVAEASTATITVMRTGTASEVTVDYATVAGGTATAGADYVATTGTLTFNAGQASRTFVVPILNDTLDEPSETVHLVLSNPTGGATLGTPSTAVLTITDDDVPGAITFSAPSYRVSETGGMALITVRRSGTASGVTVDFTTADGSATAPGDYTAVAQTLSFGAGVTSALITVPIVDDALREGQETVRLILSNPTGGAILGSYGEAVLTIVDNETGPTVQFGAAAYTVAENVAGGVFNVTITRTGSSVPGQTVQFSATAGSAAAGTDFVAVSNQVVTFTGGQASVTVPVTIVDNTSIVGSRTIDLQLSSPGAGLSLGVPRAAPLTIVEDDASLQFASATSAVAEGSAVVLTVTRTGGTIGTATVDYATSAGTATAGVDFTSKTGTLVFGPGVTSRTITVATLGDILVEGPETFTVALSNPSPAASIRLGAPSTATVTITDDDAFGTLQFASATAAVTEGGAAALTVTRTGGSAGAVTVQYATSDGGSGGSPAVGGATGDPGADYTTTSGTLTFANGVVSRTIRVPTRADSLLEGPETFTVTLSNPVGGATLGAPAAAVVTIVDDESPRLQFAKAAYSVAESAGSVTLTVQRLGPAGAQNTVQYAPAGGTATGGGTDFVSTGGVLTFPPGVTSRTIVVPINDDTVNESPETFMVTLSSPTGGAILGTPSTTTVTITDDDPAGSVQFSQASYAVVEGSPAVITVTRTGNAGPVTVNYATSNGTAIAPGDYAATSGTLTFQAGETTRTFTVGTTTDGSIEGSEWVMLALSNPTGGLTFGPLSTTTLWILGPAPSIPQASAAIQ